MCGSDRNGGLSSTCSPAVPSEEPLFRSQDDLITLQGHGGQHASDLSPGYLAIPCLAITTLVLVNAFAFFLVWLYHYPEMLMIFPPEPQSRMLGRHRAVDFEEERILRQLLLKGRYLGQRHVPPQKPNAKTASNSRGHTWLACTVAKLAPSASEDPSGVSKGLHWQDLGLQVWEHIVQRCCASATTPCPVLELDSVMSPSTQEKWPQNGRGWL